MKKLFVLVLGMMLLGAGIASATDIMVKGNYYSRGSYFDNVQATPDSTSESFGNYDQELTVDVTFKMDDTTKVFTRVEMRDDNWADSTAVTEGNTPAENDDNIVIEQVYGTHTFSNGGSLSVGLMGGGTWATAFGNTGSDVYRIKYIQPTSIGTFFAIYQKSNELSSTTTGNDEDDDVYYLAMVTKANDIAIKPLIYWADYKSDTSAADLDIYGLLFAVDGKIGSLGFEAEVNYKDYNYDSGTDYDIYGVYGNIWMQANALKAGFLAAYGSYDDDSAKSFTFGDDFDAGGALIMGDDVDFGTNTGVGLHAATLFAIYADYAINDKLSIGGYLGYADCNIDDNGIWDGASATELSGDITYKITSNLTYSIAAGICEVDYGPAGAADPDRSIEIYHKLSFDF